MLFTQHKKIVFVLVCLLLSACSDEKPTQTKTPEGLYFAHLTSARASDYRLHASQVCHERIKAKQHCAVVFGRNDEKPQPLPLREWHKMTYVYAYSSQSDLPSVSDHGQLGFLGSNVNCDYISDLKNHEGCGNLDHANALLKHFIQP